MMMMMLLLLLSARAIRKQGRVKQLFSAIYAQILAHSHAPKPYTRVLLSTSLFLLIVGPALPAFQFLLFVSVIAASFYQ
jgi:hypothetical protein